MPVTGDFSGLNSKPDGGQSSFKKRRNYGGLTLAERLDRCSMPEPNSGCQLCLKVPSTEGHCLMSWNGERRGAHVWAWIEENGQVPGGLHVLYKCDVRCCINPKHLFLGTHQDNMDDRDAKGRQPRGVRHGMVKLTEDDVLAIRASAGSDRLLASQYGVTRGAIWFIRTGGTWGHV